MNHINTDLLLSNEEHLALPKREMGTVNRTPFSIFRLGGRCYSKFGHSASRMIILAQKIK